MQEDTSVTDFHNNQPMSASSYYYSTNAGNNNSLDNSQNESFQAFLNAISRAENLQSELDSNVQQKNILNEQQVNLEKKDDVSNEPTANLNLTDESSVLEGAGIGYGNEKRLDRCAILIN